MGCLVLCTSVFFNPKSISFLQIRRSNTEPVDQFEHLLSIGNDLDHFPKCVCETQFERNFVHFIWLFGRGDKWLAFSCCFLPHLRCFMITEDPIWGVQCFILCCRTTSRNVFIQLNRGNHWAKRLTAAEKDLKSAPNSRANQHQSKCAKCQSWTMVSLSSF